jgi:hypothetical protein
MNIKDIINNMLAKLNFLDAENRISLTNITVALFVAICAFRMAFGGSIMHWGTFIYNIQNIDVSDTLPVMFSLLNYSHKRSVINNLNQTEKKEGS